MITMIGLNNNAFGLGKQSSLMYIHCKCRKNVIIILRNINITFIYPEIQVWADY